MTEQPPLYKDQITSDAWIELCDYAYNMPDYKEPYTNGWAEKSNGKLSIFSNKNEISESGVIFSGTTQYLNDLLRSIPENGNYILVTRDNDMSITEELYSLKPKSVKHWFAINCAVNHPDITAIPYGVSGIGGYSKTLEVVCDTVPRTDYENPKEILYRCNIPAEMKFPHERHKCLQELKQNSLATVIEQPIDAYDNFKLMRCHKYVAAPSGTGKCTMRICEALSCGAIPILTDCIELRNAFSDTPVMFTKDWNITWYEFQEQMARNELLSKSTDKIRMSYWKQQIENKKMEHGIGN